MLKLNNLFLEEIKEKKKTDAKLLKYKTLIEKGEEMDFKIDESGVMRCRG
ncbi:hypothetical protein A2U01_0108665, partial [Trifolium medium]|nr:hypothetical protein [Trifolium medium]